MKRIIIEASDFRDKASMYNELQLKFGTANFVGRNLDAFHDCLTMIFEPTEIIVRDYSYAKAHLGGYADLFWHVLDDASDENRNLSIIIE